MTNPFLSIARRLTRELAGRRIIPQKLAARILHRIKLGRWPDIDHPRDFNEKIMWLEFNTDTSEWSRLADKFEVREFVASRGLDHILVPLYGVWNSSSEIDLKSLPNQFVIKATNGYALILFVKDKKQFNSITFNRKVNRWTRNSFGNAGAEPHYARIKPRILAEKLLISASDDGSSQMLLDYKFLCFDGNPKYCLVCSRRDPKTFHPLLSIYSLPEWKKVDVITDPHIEPDPILPPPSLKQMISIASSLSKGFPFVRVDLYDIHGAPFFGEMTFTPAAARIDYFSPSFLLHLGSLIPLPV